MGAFLSIDLEKKNSSAPLSSLFPFSTPPLALQASRPAQKRASVAVKASDNEVDVDAIVKDIQQKASFAFEFFFSASSFFSLPPALFLFAHSFTLLLLSALNPISPQWDAVEDKPSALLYAGGAVVLLWLASTVVGAVNAVPLLPKLLELVGLGYTSWFVYRYLLFKSSREELLADIEELKKKITS